MGLHHEHIAGLEVVLPDGDIVRTGQFAMSGNPSAHLTKFSFGPSIDGLFLQSNLGVVTKMGIHMTPQPQAYMACTFDMPVLEDIETIVDVFSPMRQNGVLPHFVYVFSIVEWSSIFGKRVDWWDGEGPIPDWRVKEIQKELDTGFWTVKFGLYGPKDVIQAQYNEIEKVLAKEAPTGRLRNSQFVGENGGLLDASSVPQPNGGMFVGVPSMWSLPLTKFYNPKDGSGVGAHGAYSPLIPLDGKTVLSWVKVAKQVYESYGFDLLCDFFMHERFAVFVCMLCFDKTNSEQRIATDKIFHGLFEEGTKRGFSKYRAHINHMGMPLWSDPNLSRLVLTTLIADMVADLFDFNDHAYRRFVENIKVSGKHRDGPDLFQGRIC
jgi:hypothetical protein